MSAEYKGMHGGTMTKPNGAPKEFQAPVAIKPHDKAYRQLVARQKAYEKAGEKGTKPGSMKARGGQR